MHKDTVNRKLEKDLATISYREDTLLLTGNWCWQGIDENLLNTLNSRNTREIKRIDATGITAMDTTGAYFINKLSERLGNAEGRKTPIQLAEANKSLYKLVTDKSSTPSSSSVTRTDNRRFEMAYRVGLHTTRYMRDFLNLINFIGLLVVEIWYKLKNPSSLNLLLVLRVIGSTGMQAIIIASMLTFLIGFVLAYQMGAQLKQYGANIYIVGLLGISLLREFAPLITAIIVAGRTGSAFAAQIGTMKVQEEVDALQTFGISPISRLVLPRITGLALALPMLTVLTDISGMFGGMVMSKLYLNISYGSFLQELTKSFSVSNYIIGLVKTPFFAIIIATVGCYRGLSVKGNADSVGQETTKSVVYSIFLIILMDALFSVVFSFVGV